MKYLKLAICLSASAIYTSRYGIGSQKFGFGILGNENESSLEKSALSRFFERIIFSIGSILFLFFFLMIATFIGMEKDEQFLEWCIYISLSIHLLYHLYFIFYPIRKQCLIEGGQPIFANLIVPFTIKKLCRVSPNNIALKRMRDYEGLSHHTSNVYIGLIWAIVGCILYLSQMYISVTMVTISLISFGIISLNFFIVDTENIRLQLIGKMKDEKLNSTENQSQILPTERKKEKTLISSPL